MSVLVIILAVLAGVVGIIGSVVPALPGPPVSWVGLMILYFWGKGTNGSGEPMSLTFLLVWLGITAAVTIIDYIVPSWFTKVTGRTKAAGRGAPVGIILGTLLGAFLAELVFADKNGWESAKSALGAFMGFLCGTGIKLIASGMMMCPAVTSVSLFASAIFLPALIAATVGRIPIMPTIAVTKISLSG